MSVPIEVEPVVVDLNIYEQAKAFLSDIISDWDELTKTALQVAALLSDEISVGLLRSISAHMTHPEFLSAYAEDGWTEAGLSCVYYLTTAK